MKMKKKKPSIYFIKNIAAEIGRFPTYCYSHTLENLLLFPYENFTINQKVIERLFYFSYKDIKKTIREYFKDVDLSILLQFDESLGTYFSSFLAFLSVNNALTYENIVLLLQYLSKLNKYILENLKKTNSRICLQYYLASIYYRSGASDPNDTCKFARNIIQTLPTELRQKIEEYIEENINDFTYNIEPLNNIIFQTLQVGFVFSEKFLLERGNQFFPMNVKLLLSCVKNKTPRVLKTLLIDCLNSYIKNVYSWLIQRPYEKQIDDDLADIVILDYISN